MATLWEELVERALREDVFEQECFECGQRFRVRYLEEGESGRYEYVDEPCECQAPFGPVGDALALSQWMMYRKAARKKS